MKRLISALMVLFILTAVLPGAALGESQKSGIWEIRYTTDNNGNYTDEWYVSNSEAIEGLYAMGDDEGKLTVYIFFIDTFIAMRLIEDNGKAVENTGSQTVNYDVYLLCGDEEEEMVSLTGNMFSGMNLLSFNDADSAILKAAFDSGKEITIALADSESYEKIYGFYIKDASGADVLLAK